MPKVAAALVRARWLLMLLFVGGTLALLPFAIWLTNDRSIHSFFDPGHPLLAVYEQVEKEFGGDSVCVAVYEDPALLTKEGIERLIRIRDQLAAVPGIRKVTSLADLRRPSKPIDPRSLGKWFLDGKVKDEDLAKEILGADIYKNQFVGADGKTTAMLVLLDDAALKGGTGQVDAADSINRTWTLATDLLQFRFDRLPFFTNRTPSAQTIAGLRSAITQSPYHGTLVGAPVLLNDFFDKMEEDSWTLTTVSVAVMVLVILVLFRNLRWALLPLTIVFGTLIWLRAAVVLFGLELGFTVTMTTSLICVIGIATSIHVAVRFREEMQVDGDRRAALERTLTKEMAPVFWTCLTTAIGFGALAVSKVAPVRDFGAAMSLASMIVGLIVFLVIPGGVLIGRASATPMAAPGENILAFGLGEVEHLAVRYSWAAVAASILTIGAAATGVYWLEVETDFTKNFRGDSPVLDGYRFAEDRLGGAGLLGLSFDAPEKLSPQFLDEVRSVESALREIPGVTKVIGLTDFLDFANTGMPAMGRSGAMLGLQLKALQGQMTEEISQFWNDNQDRLRIILRVQERQASKDKLTILARMEEVAREKFGDSVHATGLYVLLVHLMDDLVSDQWMSFILSSAGALICLAIPFRSLRLGVAAFIPNMIPIVALVGLMGWLGLKVNAATAMIQSISMGLAVDFSTYYIYRVLHEIRAGAPFPAALAKSHRSTGKAMVFASIALTLGFGVLAFSNFLPTMQFGLLVSLAMAGGLIGNLVLLPVLLTWLTPKRIRERGMSDAIPSEPDADPKLEPASTLS